VTHNLVMCTSISEPLSSGLRMLMQTEDSTERCVHTACARTQIVIALKILEMIIRALQILIIQWLDRPLIRKVVCVGWDHWTVIYGRGIGVLETIMCSHLWFSFMNSFSHFLRPAEIAFYISSVLPQHYFSVLFPLTHFLGPFSFYG